MDFVDKTELLHRLYIGQQEFKNLIARIPPEQTSLPGATGTWSVKDVIAHLIAHEQRALNELDHAQRGEPYHFDHSCNDTFNEGAVLASQTQAYENVVAAWESSVASVIAAVEQLTDADFDPNGIVVQRLEDSIDGALANNTYEHWQDHGAQIEEWLGRLML